MNKTKIIVDSCCHVPNAHIKGRSNKGKSACGVLIQTHQHPKLISLQHRDFSLLRLLRFYSRQVRSGLRKFDPPFIKITELQAPNSSTFQLFCYNQLMSRKKMGYAVLITVVLAILFLLFQYLREKYCLFGYLSNTCLYRNAPPLPPGYVY